MLWYPTIFDAVTDAVTATISSLQYLFLYFSANYIGKLLNPASADGGRRPLFNDKLPAMGLLGFGIPNPFHIKGSRFLVFDIIFVIYSRCMIEMEIIWGTNQSVM